MNELTIRVNTAETLTMSSAEIAELCGKRHDNVLRDIKKMLDALGEPALKFEGSYVGKDNAPAPCYQLPKDLTITLVAGYNVLLRKRIIDRWMQLEQKVASKPTFQLDVRNHHQLAQIATQLIEFNQELEKRAQTAEAEVEKMLPDVKAFERIAKADGVHNFRDSAKMLGWRQTDFVRWLEQHGWVYRSQGDRKLRAYAETIKKGWMDEKVATVERDGVDKTYVQAVVTSKGLTTLAKEFGVIIE